MCSFIRDRLYGLNSMKGRLKWWVGKGYQRKSQISLYTVIVGI